MHQSDSMHWESRFEDWASRQEGLIAQFQLPAVACTTDHWWAARRNGRWRVLSDRVLAARASARTEAQRVLAAVLDTGPGSVLHGPSTLSWKGLKEYDLRTIHVALPRGMHEVTTKLAVVHRLRSIRAHDVVVVRGVVTETALRAIWSEAARYASPRRRDIGIQRVGRTLDNAHKLGLVTWAGLHEMVDDLQERGRAGTVIMRALAEARPPDSSPTESRNERQFEEILSRAGVELLRRQVVLGGHEPVGRSDHRDRRRPLAVEINSEIHHTTPSDVAADLVRYQRLNDAEFTVAVIWEAALWRRPAAVVRTIAEARRLAVRGERVVLHSVGCPWPTPLPHNHRILT